VSRGGLGAAYSDSELARLIQHGVKRDGRSARFMPSEDFGWLPDSDVRAIVSYVRALPASDRSTPPVSVQPLAKILDGLYDFPIDVARRTDHARTDVAPAPAPTAAYGAFVARLCRSCHGPRFSGGRIPGAPPAMVTPLNLTPDPTGLEGWTFEDFERTLRTGVRKNGMALSPFMPIDGWRNLDDVELRALWAYLTALPPLPFGNR
jgi:mono/diheme cytochrome c family protein